MRRERERERERDRQRHKDLDLPNPRKFTEFWEATSFLLSKTMSNWSKLFTWLNFLEVQWLVDVAGYKVLHDMWIDFQFLTFKNAKNYPQNSCNILQQVSNSRKKSQTPANPKKSCNRIFWNTTDRIIHCKTNARSLRNSLKLLKFWTILESKRC